MRYRVRFYGRTRGAIGCFDWFRASVEADNEEAARLKLYETHEHISSVSFYALQPGEAE